MPSRRRRSRANQSPVAKLRPEAWLWLIFAANVGIGMFLSPLTAVQKVRVVGASEDDQNRIEKELQRLQNVPVLRVSDTYLRSRLENNSRIKEAQFSPNIFGRAVVKVDLRKPVARIVNSKVCMDENGHSFSTGEKVTGVPSVVPPGGAYSLSLTAFSGWESRSIAELCRNLTAQMPNVDWNVELTDRGEISLRADGGAEVAMGSSEGLQQKVEKLKSLVTNDPDLLKKVRQINLIAPEAPMVVRD